jgi:Tfp pilus assembly protein PilV
VSGVAQRRSARGSSVAEALVAAALAGVALAAVALVARLAGAGLRQARDASTALTLAETRLEALRAGPGDEGADQIVADGIRFSRTWGVTGGRGLPTRLAVEVTWPGHRISLETGVLR